MYLLTTEKKVCVICGVLKIIDSSIICHKDIDRQSITSTFAKYFKINSRMNNIHNHKIN